MAEDWYDPIGVDMPLLNSSSNVSGACMFPTEPKQYQQVYARIKIMEYRCLSDKYYRIKRDKLISNHSFHFQLMSPTFFCPSWSSLILVFDLTLVILTADFKTTSDIITTFGRNKWHCIRAGFIASLARLTKDLSLGRSGRVGNFRIFTYTLGY